MGELEPEYEGRVDFTIVSAEETATRQDEIQAFGFAEKRHGLVAFTSAGTPLVTIAGHEFGKEEIRAAAEAVLAASE